MPTVALCQYCIHKNNRPVLKKNVAVTFLTKTYYLYSNNKESFPFVIERLLEVFELYDLALEYNMPLLQCSYLHLPILQNLPSFQHISPDN